MSALFDLKVALRNLNLCLNHDWPVEADVVEVMSRPFDKVLVEINTRPPEDLTDCAIKIRHLANPAYGLQRRYCPGDFIVLRQVAEFLSADVGTA
jgi:hypothetical protein